MSLLPHILMTLPKRHKGPFKKVITEYRRWLKKIGLIEEKTFIDKGPPNDREDKFPGNEKEGWYTILMA